VFPSDPRAITGFQGVHSSHFLCVKTVHAPSLTCFSYHTLATNRDILPASMRNHGQGDTVQPIARTPTPNNMRSNWDLLLGRSPEMMVGQSPLTFLALEGGPNDKLCPLIPF